MNRTKPLVGQMTLEAIPGVTTADRIQAARKVKTTRKVQQPMDIGLFSDDAAQLDLLDMGMFQDPVEN